MLAQILSLTINFYSTYNPSSTLSSWSSEIDTRDERGRRISTCRFAE